MNLQIQDFFVSYPSIYAQEFQYLIGSKKEFYDLKLSLKEAVPGRSQFFKHQLIVHRFLRAYDELLIFHSTGTGKSRSVSGLAEYYKKNRSFINHVYILVKGKTLRREIQHDIICAYPEEYETEKLRQSKTGKQQNLNITLTLKKWYTIRTQKRFAFELRHKYWTKSEETLRFVEEEQKKEEEREKKKRRKPLYWHLGTPDIAAIERDYSGCIFWIDEAHNLRVDPKADYDLENIEESELKFKEKEIVYQTLHVLFHAVKRSKKILTTATPMVNDPSEIQPLMNLLLPLDKQMTNIDYATVSLEELIPYFQGRISYVRAFETGAIPSFIGQEIGSHPTEEGKVIDYKTKIFVTNMTEHQTAGYIASRSYKYPAKKKKGRIPQIGGAKPTSGHGVYMPENQASNFVYPDGSFGPDGYEKYIRRLGPDNYQAKLELASVIKTPNEIAWFSSKYGNICSRLAFKPQHLRIDEITGQTIPTETGNFFIYGELLEGSGLITLGLCLEALGYQKFVETRSIFSREDEDIDYCGIRTRRGGDERKANIDPAPRYALIGKDVSDSKISAILDAMNSYENRHGQYIKVLLASPMGKEGINVANILNIEIIDSEWNPSGTFQALSRGIRATSHVDLLKEKAEAENRPLEEVTIDVNIRLHCSLPRDPNRFTKEQLSEMSIEELRTFYVSYGVKEPDDQDLLSYLLEDLKKNPELEDPEFKNIPSINVDMYTTSEDKDHEIKRIERFMKQISFDCWLNYLRNVRPGETDGSQQCDYQECEYRCINQIPNTLEHDDRSTFDMLYADQYLEVIGKDVIEYFTDNFSATLNQLYVTFKDRYESKYIDMAIDKLIRSKSQLLDRFGFTSYLREESGTVYLSREYPVRNRERFVEMYPLLNYFSSMIAESTSNISDLVTQTIKPVETAKASRIDPNDPDFDRKIDELDISVKIDLLEEAIINLENGTDSELHQKIRDKFIFYWLKTTVPQERINEIQTQMSTKGIKSQKGGEKIEIKTLTRDELTEEEEEDDGEEVYVHILSMIGELSRKQTKYDIMAKFRKADADYRIYQPSTGNKFRSPAPYELVAYNEKMQRRIYFEYLRPLIPKGLFGSLISGVFRIHDHIGEDPDAIFDNRKGSRGRECNHNIPILVDFLWHLKHDAPEEIEVEVLTKLQMIDYLKSKKVKNPEEFSNEKLLFFTRWFSGNYRKDDYCNFLFSYLKDNGLLFVP